MAVSMQLDNALLLRFSSQKSERVDDKRDKSSVEDMDTFKSETLKAYDCRFFKHSTQLFRHLHLCKPGPRRVLEGM